MTQTAAPPVIDLVVPVPLAELPSAGVAELEKPVTLRLDAVRHPDGRVVAEDEALKVGAFVYRSFGGGEEIWNETEQRWSPPPTELVALRDWTPAPFTFKAGAPRPWSGVLVAAGQKDGAGAPLFQPAQNGVPFYRLRAFVQATRDGIEHIGLGAPSGEIRFVSAAESQRFTVKLDPEDPKACRKVRFLLKNSSLQNAAFIEIRTAGGQEVEVANCDSGGSTLARIVLESNGDIRLRPASGRNIVLDGDLEAERIRYQPDGGGARQTL